MRRRCRSHIHVFQLRPTPIECWHIENFNDILKEFCFVKYSYYNIEKKAWWGRIYCYESICSIRGIKYERKKRGCASEIWRKATDCHDRKLHPADEPPALGCSQATWITFNNSLLHFWWFNSARVEFFKLLKKKFKRDGIRWTGGGTNFTGKHQNRNGRCLPASQFWDWDSGQRKIRSTFSTLHCCFSWSIFFPLIKLFYLSAS